MPYVKLSKLRCLKVFEGGGGGGGGAGGGSGHRSQRFKTQNHKSQSF